jgi:hypothetical protein
MLSQRRILAKELFFRPRSRSKRRFHFLRFNFLPIERCPERMVLERRPLVIFVVGLLVIFLFRVVSTIRTTVVSVSALSQVLAASHSVVSCRLSARHHTAIEKLQGATHMALPILLAPVNELRPSGHSSRGVEGRRLFGRRRQKLADFSEKLDEDNPIHCYTL